MGYLKKITIFSLLFVSYSILAYPPSHLPVPAKIAQNIRRPVGSETLSLHEAVLLALRYNPDVQNAELDRILDKFDLELAYWAFKPHYSLKGGADYVHGAKPEYELTPSVSLETPIGTKISADFNNQLVGSASPSVDLTLTQPLLRGFGADVNANTVALRNQLDQEIINRLALKNTVMATVVKVIAAYLQLSEDYNSVHIEKLQLQQSLTTYKEYQIKIKAGKIPPRDIVQQEFTIAQQKYAIEDAENRLQQDYHNLITILGLKSSAKIIIDRHIMTNAIKIPDLKHSKDLALINNTAYRQALLTLKQDQQNLRVAKDQQHWELDLSAKTTFTNGRLISGVGPKIVSQAQSGRSVSLDLNIPIDDMANKDDLLKAKIALEKQLVNVAQIRRQAETAVATNLRTIKSQLRQIKQAYLSEKLAQESYEIEKIKWTHGRSTNIDLNNTLEAVKEQQNNIVAAKIGYLNALAQYQETIGSLLDVWGIKLRY